MQASVPPATPAQAAVPPALQAQDLLLLAGEERAALLVALRELNLARVAQLLAALPASAAPLLAPLQAMLEQHQYRQLCVLLESEGVLAHA